MTTSRVGGPSCDVAAESTTPAPATARATDTATVGNAQAYDRSYTYDLAGRLTTVADRTATVAMGSLTPDTAASGLAPCQVRTYGFNSDGARTTYGVENHSDGDCAGTTAGTVTTATTAYHLDNADRFTTAASADGSTGAGYSYDGLGRQSTIPAADTPAGAGAGDLRLGYYVDDLPQSVSQNGVTSAFGLDAAGRRATQTVTGGTDDGTTVTRHYTDGSDNPGWETTTPAGGGATGGAPMLTRFTDSLDGTLGAMITATGEATIPLVDPHGNNVTSITIPSAASTTDACTGIDAWGSYTEYGTPSAGTTPSGTVTGPLGYGWLGTHQRATGPDTASLTLMGVRYYNPATGAFTSPDPIPGGNNTSYGYPDDPINTTDLTGQAGRGGNRGEPDRLSAAEEKALADFKAGRHTNLGDYNRAIKKIVKNQKLSGARNQRKRQGRNHSNFWGELWGGIRSSWDGTLEIRRAILSVTFVIGAVAVMTRRMYWSGHDF